MTGDLFEPGKLPSSEERRMILERARQVLNEARAILEQLDATQGRLPIGAQTCGVQKLFSPDTVSAA